MQRISAPGNSGERFVDEDVARGRIGTMVDAAWLNAVQEELVALVQAGAAIDNSIALLPFNPNNEATFNAVRRSVQALINAKSSDHSSAANPHPQYALGLDVVRTNAIQLQFNVANTRHSWRALLA